MPGQILIYDDNCPLCCWYSGLFVKCGLLTADGRKSFSDLDPALANAIDFYRSRHEIPLINPAADNVLYGIDALLELLEQKRKWISRAGKIPPVYWFLKKLYKFISYNRKVIVAKKCGPGKIDCAPDIHYRYRYLMVALIFLLMTFLTGPLYNLLLALFASVTLTLRQFQLAYGILILVNCFAAVILKKQMVAEYLGQLGMLALLSAVFLLPLLLLHLFTSPDPNFAAICFFAVSIILLKEYTRRMQYAGLFQGNHWMAGINLASIICLLLFVFHKG